MIPTPKFNRQETVWSISCGRLSSYTIIDILIYRSASEISYDESESWWVDSQYIYYKYKLPCNCKSPLHEEYEIFSTKEEAIKRFKTNYKLRAV